MIQIDNEVYKNLSVLESFWKLKDCEERLILAHSQKNNISFLLSKLLLSREINDNLINSYLSPNIKNDLPDPFILSDMDKAVSRTIKAINENEKIGIIADYDVDGSTSASILYKFLKNFLINVKVIIPDRLNEGYGPNTRIMDEMLKNNIKIIFTLDCGTTANNIIDDSKYTSIDIIVIDHHLSEENLPKVFSIINPNKKNELNKLNQIAAVGVTFLFLMALRKKLRSLNYFEKKFKEPNLLNYLDLVALGTICDVVDLNNYNRLFVKIGLEIIKKRKNLSITKLIDNSNIQSTPIASDLAYIIGPQLNAASRMDNSSLPFKLLVNSNILEIESISKKLLLLNEKRKLFENEIYNQAIIQAEKQKKNKFILVYGNDWHNGVLGIIASRLMSHFYKPAIVISFTNSIGLGSARSINNIDLGNIILEAKNKKILMNGGGHKMAAGFKIKLNFLDNFNEFLEKKFLNFSDNLFIKYESFDSVISVNAINEELIDIIDSLEPFGAGNPEPKFIINDLIIKNVKILKDKHLLIFFQNDFSNNLKAICFNCVGTALGDHLLNYNKYKFSIGCIIKKDTFNEIVKPQIIIKDLMIID